MLKYRTTAVLLSVLGGAGFVACLLWVEDPQAASEPQPRLGIHTPAPVHETAPDTGGCPVYATDPGAEGIHRGVLTAFEGYSDTAYQPSERSGPTIGFGLDLAHASPTSIRYVLRGLVSKSDMDELLTAQGLSGKRARAWIAWHKHIRLDPCTKHVIETRQYAHYWRAVVQQVPGLVQAPDVVKTAVTSYAMHTGNVDPLLPALRARDWHQLELMLRGRSWSGPESSWFRDRRHAEADLLQLANRKLQVDTD